MRPNKEIWQTIPFAFPEFGNLCDIAPDRRTGGGCGTD